MADGKTASAESAMGWGLLLLVFAGIGWLIWQYFSTELKNIVRWIRYAEMWIASWFLPQDYAVTVNGQKIPLEKMLEITGRIPVDRLDAQFMSIASHVALTPYLIPIGLIALYCGFWAQRKGPGTEHRRNYDLDGLIRRQANMFPVIAPFVNFNPSSIAPRAPGSPVPAELPIFAEALSPEEWVVYNEIPVTENGVDKQAAMKAFTQQLGPRWKGYKALAPHKQVLLAAFCLKAARKRSDADDLLGRLALCWSEKKGLKISRDILKETRSILSNKTLSEKTLRLCNQHAWETTALLRALNTAREEGGVLAPAQFVWLRAHDRALWYPLNNLGRQSLHAEAIGAMSQYKSEKMVSRPIPRPKMEDPAKSLSEYIASNKSRTLPQLDYSNSKKRGVKQLKSA